MADEETPVLELDEPLFEWYIEGEVDDPDTYAVVITAYGEAGKKVVLRMSDSADTERAGLMFQQITRDLRTAELDGLQVLLDRLGAQPEDITVEEILKHGEDDGG